MNCLILSCFQRLPEIDEFHKEFKNALDRFLLYNSKRIDINDFKSENKESVKINYPIHVCSDKELIISTIGAFVYYKNDYFTW